VEAIMSPCLKYRYILRREIQQPIRWNKRCLFVMLNPSTADAFIDDPTIRRCVGFAKSWGGTSMTVVNLFALRATNPKELSASNDPIGPENNEHLLEEMNSHHAGGIIVAAWGAHKFATDRAAHFMAAYHQFSIFCLGQTKLGAPRHPLYVRGNKEREFYKLTEALKDTEEQK